MADKYEIAAYLVNLNTLLMAQEDVGGVTKSRVIADEYTRNWTVLKDLIQKESPDV